MAHSPWTPRTKLTTTSFAARNGGTLNINAITLDNTNGNIDVQTGTNLNLSQATVVGGFFSGNGDVNITSTLATLRAAPGLPQILGAVFNIAGGQTLNLDGDTFQIDGLIRLNGEDSDPAVLETTNASGPTVNLTGLGRIEFAASGVLPCTFDVGPDLTVVALAGATGTIQAPLNNNGTLIANGTLSFKDDGRLINETTGIVGGTGLIAVTTQTLDNHGRIAPGPEPGSVAFDVMPAPDINPIGRLTVGGSLVQGSEGVIEIQMVEPQTSLSAVAGVDFDQLVITDNASLAGHLDILLIDGFVPKLGDLFPVVTANTRHGVFERIDGMWLEGGDMALAPIYDYQNSAGLTLVAALPGDANLDGIVNTDDLDIFFANADSQGDWLSANFNGDANVDLHDLDFILRNLGRTVPMPNFQPTLLSIPEPTTAMLAATGMLTILKRRGRRIASFQ